MRYVLAIDGGATKTHCLVGDERGTVLAEAIGGSSNYHNMGEEAALRNIGDAIHLALRKVNLRIEDISMAYLGLSSADAPEDLATLTQLLGPLFQGVRFKIVNDCWIGMARGVPEGWGAVTIAGTGANAAARNPEGVEVSLRSLNYPLGNFGGGGDMALDALHHAFRSEEGTGPRTALESEIPKALGVANLAELVQPIFRGEKHPEEFCQIPPRVFALANLGDEVCQEILLKFGADAGRMVAGVIVRAGMAQLEVPVVLTGSLYKGESPLLLDALTLALHRQVPKAYLLNPSAPPVMGAFYEGLRHLGIEYKPLI